MTQVGATLGVYHLHLHHDTQHTNSTRLWALKFKPMDAQLCIPWSALQCTTRTEMLTGQLSLCSPCGLQQWMPRACLHHWLTLSQLELSCACTYHKLHIHTSTCINTPPPVNLLPHTQLLCDTQHGPAHPRHPRDGPVHNLHHMVRVNGGIEAGPTCSKRSSEPNAPAGQQHMLQFTSMIVRPICMCHDGLCTGSTAVFKPS